MTVDYFDQSYPPSLWESEPPGSGIVWAIDIFPTDSATLGTVVYLGIFDSAEGDTAPSAAFGAGIDWGAGEAFWHPPMPATNGVGYYQYTHATTGAKAIHAHMANGQDLTVNLTVTGGAES